MKTKNHVPPPPCSRAFEYCLQRLAPALLFTAWTALPIPRAGALDPTVEKLFAKNSTVQTNPVFGVKVAANDKWTIVAEPANDDDGLDADTLPDLNSGAIHVFSTATGQYVRKLRASDASAEARLGSSLDLYGDKLVAGAPNANAAYVFNVATGVQEKKLVPDVAAGFGIAVAIGEGTALVGDTAGGGATSKSGTVYVFHLNAAGAVLSPAAELNPSDGGDNHNFGCSVALQGKLALVGATHANGAAPETGAGYLFDISQPGPIIQELTKFQLSLPLTVAAGGDQFGSCVALNGRRALIGAPLADGPTNVFEDVDTGLAALFDITAPGPVVNELTILRASNRKANEEFASSVALQGNIALVGAFRDDDRGTYAGACYVFNLLPTGEAETPEFVKLTAPDGAVLDLFGISVGLTPGGMAIVGAAGDDDAGPDSGSAYRYNGLAGPFPMRKLAGLKDFAPGAQVATFASFGDAFINEEAEVLFPATLKAASGGLNGMWSTLAPTQSLDLVLRALDQDFDPGAGLVRAITVSNNIVNQPDRGVMIATLSGTGVTTANNRIILGDDGETLTPLLRTDETTPGLEGGTVKIAKFVQLVQGKSAATGEALAYQLKLGTGGVNLANDTGVLTLTNAGEVSDFVRENDFTADNISGLMTDTPSYGQFSGVSMSSATDVVAIFAAALQGGTPAVTAANNQAVFMFEAGGLELAVARKGSQVADMPGGVVFNTFLGQTSDPSNSMVLLRAIVKGPGITTANDEVLWKASGGNQLVVQEGDQVPGLTPAGPVWAGFPQYWRLPGAADGHIFILAKIRGAGITTSNDMGLWLLQEDQSFLLLMREGYPAPGCDGARVGVIQRVAVDTVNGHYAILASLTNAPATSNQALFTGNARIPTTVDRKELRKPFRALLKNTLYQRPAGGTTRLKSISLPAGAFDATGAGGKGLGQPINENGAMVLNLTFTDNDQQLVIGAP